MDRNLWGGWALRSGFITGEFSRGNTYDNIGEMNDRIKTDRRKHKKVARCLL